MLKKLGLVDLHASLKEQIERLTGLPAYDSVPENAPAPFYFLEIVDKRPEHSKTMWKEVYTVWIHAVAQKGKGKVAIYSLIESLEDALTEQLALPEGITLISQTEAGMQSLQLDETDEWHAVLAFEIRVSYGFKAKI